MRLADDNRVLANTADLSQAARAAADLMTSDVRRAGTAMGLPMAALVPALLPYRLGVDPPLSAADDRITILYQEAGAPSARLGAPLLSADTRIVIASGGACGTDPACGFEPGMRVLLADTTAPGAGFDLVTVAAVGPGWIDRAPTPLYLTRGYAAGTAVAASLTERSYYLDRTDARGPRLMRSENGGSAQPVMNGVTELRFEYYAATDAAAVSRRGAESGTCVFDPGPPLAARLMPLAGPSPALILPAMFSDGPACGGGTTMFDGDLLRIRRVRMHVRVAAAAWGTGTAPALPVTMDVAPPSLAVRW
jgi:hypothetical protein